MFNSDQNEPCTSRRQFLRLSGAVAVAAACEGHIVAALTQQAMTQPTPIQIGVLLGTFPEPTFEGKLDACKAAGITCVQVSLDCAGAPAMPDEITLELSRRIRREAANRGMTVTSVQGTYNMSHPDAEYRQNGLRRLRVLAQSCAAMGTAKIHLCSGTRDRENMWRRHPDNQSPEAWRDMMASMREAVDIARQANVILAFEPEVNNVVDSAQKARRLLDDIGSPHLKVNMDAANLFHTGELPRMKEILDEAFALLGKDIVLAHAKDLDHDGDAGHLPAGHGKLDYSRYIQLLQTCGCKAPLLLHGLSEAQVPGCVAFLRDKMAAKP